MHRLVLVALTPLGMFLLLLGTAFLSEVLEDTLGGGYPGSRWELAYIGAALCVILSPLLGALLVKDWLLIRRVRRVIRARGTCPSCGYVLLGVVVGEGNTVICPECGIGVEADPALNELATDEQGRRSFAPPDDHEGRSLLSPRAVRRLKRLAVAAAVLVFVGGPILWGVYELFLWRQAVTAGAERPGAAGMNAYVEGLQPPGVSVMEPNGWDALAEAAMLLDEAESALQRRPPFSSPSGPVFIDYGSIAGGIDHEPSDSRYGEVVRSRNVALGLIESESGGELFEKIDALAGYRRAARLVAPMPDQPAINMLLPNLSDARHLARLNGARMHLAWEEGDRGEFIAALESGLAIARYCELQPTLIERLVAIAVSQLMHDRVQAVLLRQPEAAWLDEIEGAIARQRPAVPASTMAEGEALMGLDTIAWLFSDPDRVRLGRFSSHLAQMAGARPAWDEGRLGTYAANRDAYLRVMEQFGVQVALEPYERQRAPDATSDLLVVELLTPGYWRSIDAMDVSNATRRATALMIALERWRLAEGDYPDSLDLLVPRFMEKLPTDPWTGQAFRYRLLSAGTPGGDGAGSYLLYSVGMDGRDDGGRREHRADLVFSPRED